jgi:hypothetical protein
MSNSKTVYNDFVRANLPEYIRYDSVRNQYVTVNGKRFVTYKEAKWYTDYIIKNGSIIDRAIGFNIPQTIADFSDDTFTSANKSLGPELVTNGTFDSDTSGWTGDDATLSVVSGKMRVTSTGDYGRAFQGISVQGGKSYVVYAEVDFISGTSSETEVTFSSNSSSGGGAPVANNSVISGSGTHIFTWVAPATGTYYLRIQSNTASTNEVFDVDNISVREVVSYSPASTTAESLLTHTRAGTATYTDSTGTLQTAATNELRKDNHIWDGSSWVKRCLVEPQSTNLVLNSDSLETQTVAVTPNEPHTLSFYPGASTVDLDESIASTAVDVFVYDTSKDSDGGAWRTGALAQASSWYNETLNTSTRGSRREFPAVAVIVAEASKVTIYDGDDPSLPMWMVFANGGGNWIEYSAGLIEVSSVDARNAILVVGSNGTAAQGVKVFNFVADGAYQQRTADLYQGIYGTTSERNDGLGVYLRSDVGNIVNETVNDCAMTVLPDAPTDPVTGLPVPTIAVATDSGVSVIKDDGTVVDDGWGDASRNVDFDSGDNLWWTRNNYAARYYYASKSDYLAGDGFGDRISDAVPALAGTTNANQLVADEQVYFANGAIVSGDSRPCLMVHAANTSSPTASFSKGMSALLTSTYNTGWMNGDIKLAALSDTDDTDLVANDKITNGDNEASLFTPLDATRATVAQSSEQASTGTFSAKATFSGGSASHYITAVSIPANEAIYFSYDIYIPASYTGSGIKAIDTSDGSFSTATVNTRDAWVTVSGSRGAKATTWPLGIGQNFAENVDGQSVYIDNLTVKTLDPDRSVNNNGLSVNGTVTRTPVATGADLAAYSGFSSSNYLEQPYNSDLDFGTGDFCVMGWVNVTGTASVQYLLDSRNVPLTDGFYVALVNGTLSVLTADASANSNTFGSTDIRNSTWAFITAVRKDSGTTQQVYVNGSLETSDTVTARNISDASRKTRIGARVDTGTTPLQGSLALLRISATAPTADQILKIYNDEKVLFQDNAQATLYGASDAVTALAYDEDTDLLHVGTSAGRSVFNGLRRINNTTTGVTTAISATNGVIAEQ